MASKRKYPRATVTADVNMVTVALNHPHGIRFPLPNGETVLIRGNADNLRGKEKGIIPVGKYGYTRLPADQWEYIRKTYGNMAVFENDLIFAASGKDRAEEQAEEQAETRHGREPVDTAEAETQEAKEEA